MATRPRIAGSATRENSNAGRRGRSTSGSQPENAIAAVATSDSAASSVPGW